MKSNPKSGLKNRLLELVRQQLRQGTTPHGLALTCAWGVVLGIFPILGLTTTLCALVGLTLKLNQPVLQFVNYLMAPCQLLLLPVFLYAGEFILRVPHLTLNPATLLKEFFANMTGFVQHFGMAALYAIFAWLLIAPFVGFIFYKTTRPVFVRLRKSNEPSSHSAS